MNLSNVDKWMRGSCPSCVLQVSCYIRPIDKVSVFSVKLIHIDLGNNGSEKARGQGITLEGALTALEVDFRTKYVRSSKHGG